MAQQRFHLFGSSRPTAEAIGAADPGESLSATIYVRRDPGAPHLPATREQSHLAPGIRTYLRPEAAIAVFAAAQADLDQVKAFAKQHGLEIEEESIAKRLVRVRGTVKQMNEAFNVDLRRYQHPRAGEFRAHEGDVQLPAELADVVEGVLGLDNRMMIHSRLRPSSRELTRKGASETLPPNTYAPPTLAKLFDFPAGEGAGQCVAVLAFNGQVMSTGQSAPGGYEPKALGDYFTKTLGQQTPKLTDVVVQGPGNQFGDGSDPNDTTGEVLLDLCTVGAIVPAANVAVYFTEFTEEGWVNAIKTAVSDTVNKPTVLSISYGNPEDDETKGLWSGQAIKLINDAFEQAAAQGITICCASGDNGSDDEPEATTDHVDFPASSPWVLACGGIRLEADPVTMTISSEQVWNDLASSEGASGGGVSRLFARPDWQANAKVPPNADGSGKTGRGVPDVAGLADPETPLWVLTPNGQLGGVGGTSAAAPLWSGLVTLLNGLTGTRLGFLNPPLYAHLKDSLVDIVMGNNGSYPARAGWDACTGWGRPDGKRLLQALQATATSPATQPGVSPAGQPAGAQPAGVPAATPISPDGAAAPPMPAQTPSATPGPAPSATPGPAPSATPSVPGLGTNLVGPQGQLFADPQPGGDENGFQIDNTSAQYYKSPYYKLHCEQLQPVPAPRLDPPHIDLAEVIGHGPLLPRVAAKRIVFHAAGDTGPSSASHIKTEASVADAMSAELAAAVGAEAPAFLFHLGDVVYNFGEPQYYYDQFYEPFRAYDAPIFAINGNHDMSAEVNQEGKESEAEQSLFAFLRNFCAATPGPSPDAGGLVRTTMTQPGVYFTLEAPFVSIIGLCSNVLEGPGVISSEGGRYPIGDEQLQFLIAELRRLKPQREAGERAVILTCHHPPLSIDEKHGGARGLAEDIDKASEAAGLRPDAVLSGHAHLYQRYMRTVEDTEIPYIVSGSGGHNVTRPAANAAEASLPEGYELAVKPILDYGYLTLTVDMSGKAPTLRVVFNATSGKPGALDSVTIDLQTRRAL